MKRRSVVSRKDGEQENLAKRRSVMSRKDGEQEELVKRSIVSRKDGCIIHSMHTAWSRLMTLCQGFGSAG